MACLGQACICLLLGRMPAIQAFLFQYHISFLILLDSKKLVLCRKLKFPVLDSLV